MKEMKKALYYLFTVFIIMLISACGTSDNEVSDSTGITDNSGKDDIAPPSIQILSHSDGDKITTSQITVIAKVTDENSVEVLVNGGKAVIDGENYSAKISLIEGTNALSVEATDASGNIARVDIEVVLQVIDIESRSILITQPSSLQTFGTSPITINGTVSSPEAVILVNREVVTNDNGTFSAQVALNEGFNAISVISRLNGVEHVDSITAALDLTPAIITINSHEDKQKVFTDKVTITGLVNDTVRGSISEGDVIVIVNGSKAKVANRSYAAIDIPLDIGANNINIAATDLVGNISRKNITLNREELVGDRIEIISGQNQTTEISTQLVAPLKIKVTNDKGEALSSRDVIFRVIQGDGVVGVDKERAVVVTTDVNGEASTNFKIGSRIGTANQKVGATIVGLESSVVFTATATGNLVINLTINIGNNQRGVIGQRLPQPLVTYVSDTGFNPVRNAKVRFVVTAGTGKFSNGLQTIDVISSSNWFAVAEFTLGSELGMDAQKVIATLMDTSKSILPTASFTATAYVAGDSADTKLSGIVLDNQENPLEGVTLRIEDTSVSGMTNSNGQFQLDRVPVGPIHLFVDGSTVTSTNGEYPTLSFNSVMVQGINNTLPQPIYMVRLTETDIAQVSLTQGGILTMQDFPGWKLEVSPGAATFPNGAKEGVISATVVNADKVPMTPPNGLQPQLVVTIQPSGTLFDPPAKISIPNVDGLAIGQQIDMYSFDHDLQEFVSIGLGTVNDDGTVIESNPGVGILKAGWFASFQFPTGFGLVGSFCSWSGLCNANPNDSSEEEPCDLVCHLKHVGDVVDELINAASMKCDSIEICALLKNNSADDWQQLFSETSKKIDDGSKRVNGLINAELELAKEDFAIAIATAEKDLYRYAQRALDPVVMATGELEFTQTDLKIPGRGFDFELKRTYRSRIHFNGRLGYNWVFNYHEMLVIPDVSDANQNVQRSMPNGLQYIYVKNTDGSYQSPESIFEVLTKKTDNTYTIRKPDGFKINYSAAGQMLSHQDRNGNTMRFEYDAEERLVKIIDTLGRDIVFSYRSDSGHIDTVTDFIGRSVRYYYDANRNLSAARTPVVTGTPNGNDFINGKFTQYTYSSGFDEVANPKLRHANHNLLTVTDAFGFQYLTNIYVNDPSSYEFDKIVEQQFGKSTQKFQANYQEIIPTTSVRGVNTPINKSIVIDRNGNHIEYLHGKGGMLLEQRVYTNRNINAKDPDVFVTKNRYNQDGLLVQTTNPEGDSSHYSYDSENPLRYMQRNRLSSKVTPGSRGAVQAELLGQYSYEPIYNQLRTIINRRGFTTTHTFDYQHTSNLAALATELNQSEAEITMMLSNAGMSLNGGVSGQVGGNIVRIDLPTTTLADASSQAIFSTYSYNRFGQMVEEVDVEGIVQKIEYYPENDPDGDGLNTTSSRVLATDTGGYLKAIIKDARIAPRRNRAGPALAIREEIKYDVVGNKIAITDGRGNTTRYIHNQLNQVVRKIDSAPFEYMTDYYYDANNNVVRTSRQNIGTTGPNLSSWVHTVVNYNELNEKIREIKIPQTGTYLETHYEYDANQNITAIQQPEGNRIERIYDERNLVYQTTQGAGTALASSKAMSYDGNGNLTQVIDAEDTNGDGLADTTRIIYDGYNRPIQSTDAESNRVTYQYDANANKVLERHFGASGITGIDNKILLAEIAIQFDELDRPYQRDDSLLVNGQAQNVGAGVTPDDNKVTGINYYDASGLIVRSIDDNGNETLNEFDGLNRLIRTTDANGNVNQSTYDQNNNLTQIAITQVNEEGRVADKVITIIASYDELNRKTSTTNQLGNTESYQYDSHNNRVVTTDEMGNIVLNIYDGLNRLIETREYLATGGTGEGAIDQSNPTNADGYISTYFGYDGNSRLVFQGDDKQNATNYEFDALNRKVKESYADGSNVNYVYDKDNNIVSATDQNGSVFTHSYDALNRLTQSKVAAAIGIIGSTEWAYSYDGLSRRVSAKDNNEPSLSSDDSVVEYRYNSLNHLLSENNNGLLTGALYDGLGNRQKIRYASGRRLNYSYDKLYNIKAINEANPLGVNTSAIAIAEYDYASRRVLERRYANGTRLSYIQEGVGASNDSRYDAINRVVQHRHSNSSNALVAGFDYAYDKANNRRYEVDQFAQLADVYEYDSVYRVIRTAYRVPANDATLQTVVNNSNSNAEVESIISPQDESYLLDGVGNWASVQALNGKQSDAVGYQSNEMNEYTRIGAVEQNHDSNGNLTSDGNRNYHYDARNRLVRVSTLSGNTLANYKYDAYGRRIEKRAGSEAVRYVHFGKQVLEERNAFNELQRSYVYGNGIDEVLQLKTASNDSYYYHDNSIGSIAALTDTAGRVAERYRYNVYGETTILAADGITERQNSAIGNSYGFTGRRYDVETGFYYYRARYYVPERGRFIQRDPLGYVDGMGVYAYVGNNPVNYVDPEGEFAHIAYFALAGSVGGIVTQAVMDVASGSDFKWKNYADSALNGAYSGALIAVTGGGGGLLVTAAKEVAANALGGIVGDVAKQTIESWTDDSFTYNVGETAKAGLVHGLGGLGGTVGKLTNKLGLRSFIPTPTEVFTTLPLLKLSSFFKTKATVKSLFSDTVSGVTGGLWVAQAKGCAFKQL